MPSTSEPIGGAFRPSRPNTSDWRRSKEPSALVSVQSLPACRRGSSAALKPEKHRRPGSKATVEGGGTTTMRLSGKMHLTGGWQDGRDTHHVLEIGEAAQEICENKVQSKHYLIKQ